MIRLVDDPERPSQRFCTISILDAPGGNQLALEDQLAEYMGESAIVLYRGYLRGCHDAIAEQVPGYRCDAIKIRGVVQDMAQAAELADTLQEVEPGVGVMCSRINGWFAYSGDNNLVNPTYHWALAEDYKYRKSVDVEGTDPGPFDPEVVYPPQSKVGDIVLFSVMPGTRDEFLEEGLRGFLRDYLPPEDEKCPEYNYEDFRSLHPRVTGKDKYTRVIKVTGVYPDKESAEGALAKESMTNAVFNSLVGYTGLWLPVNSEAHETIEAQIHPDPVIQDMYDRRMEDERKIAQMGVL